MVQPVVEQLRFTRSEWVRGLTGLTDDEARRRFPPLNSISWLIGHLAWQEQRYWLTWAQGRIAVPDLNTLVANGAAATTPPLAAMWDAWRTVTGEADAYLATLTADALTLPLTVDGRPDRETVGTRILRGIYHYWYHLGEALAIRQLLGHTGLPDFVGALGDEAPFRLA